MNTLEKIIKLINENCQSEQHFLSELGFNRTLLSDWKSGKSKSYKKHIDRIAKYFNVSTDYLLGNESAPAPETDDNIKFALFGTTEVTDEIYDQVKAFAKFALDTENRKNNK